MSSTKHSRRAVILRLAACCLSALLVMSVAGCEGDRFGGLQRYAVKGKVLLADGKPLTNGRVVFLSDAPPASGAAEIGGDGAFEFKGPSGDGLPAAKYRVHITPAPTAGNPSGGRARAAKVPFASKYLDDDTSELTATVTTDESKNQFEFKLETKNAPAPTSAGDRR
jgi:hypothetical protein